MTIKDIKFEAGIITVTPSEGSPYVVPLAALTGGSMTSALMILLEALAATSALAADLDLLAGLAAASKDVVKVYEKTIDCSADETAEAQALVTLPIGSVILEVVTHCLVAFNGDTTKTFEVGIAANTDKYIDPVDCSVTLDGIMSVHGGTNQDQKIAEVCVVSTPIIATWTNTASPTAGSMKVRILYV